MGFLFHLTEKKKQQNNSDFNSRNYYSIKTKAYTTGFKLHSDVYNKLTLALKAIIGAVHNLSRFAYMVNLVWDNIILIIRLDNFELHPINIKLNLFIFNI